MVKFNLLSYCTKYSAKGDVNVSEKTDYCFGSVFNSGRQNKTEEYNIFIYKGLEQGEKHYKNNNCILTKNQLKSHCDFLKKLLNIKIVIKEREKYFIVKVQLSACESAHRFVLTWIRYAYEAPFSLALMSAIKVKKYLPKLNKFDVFHLALESIYDKNGRDIHSMIERGRQFKIAKIEDLKKAILNCNARTLHEALRPVSNCYPIDFDKQDYDDTTSETMELFIDKVAEKCMINYKTLLKKQHESKSNKL